VAYFELGWKRTRLPILTRRTQDKHFGKESEFILVPNDDRLRAYVE
jgi:hypothetical protein